MPFGKSRRSTAGTTSKTFEIVTSVDGSDPFMDASVRKRVAFQFKVYTTNMNEINLPPARNVFNEPLVPCSFNPVTGFFRDGCCKTNQEDIGTHVVCVVMTEDFLEFSSSQGNDLSTPIPEWGFPGLKPGDQWCLCALRWVEAFQAN